MAPAQPDQKQEITFQPPTNPAIPAANIQALILRLTHAIHDIDAFQNLLASGAQTGTMPSWELILQRYTMTMNRVNALTSYLSRPPPIPAPSARTAADPGPSQRPVLSNYLVHPLQPLPLPTADGTDPINPIARDVLEFVMSTLPLPQISASEAELLSQPPWSSNEELRSMGPDELTRLRSTLVGRLQREGRRSQALKEEIRRQNEEYTWNLRIDDEADEEEEAGGPLEVEVIDVDAEPQKSEKVELKKDPQESWTLVDYMRFIDHGRLPDPS